MYIIRIPKEIKFYLNKNTLAIKGPLGYIQIIKPLVLNIEQISNKLILKSKVKLRPKFTIKNISNSKIKAVKKCLKQTQFTVLKIFYTYLKQTFRGLVSGYHQQLNLVGVGYRFLVSKNRKLLTIVAGFSHRVYYRFPKNITMFTKKKTKLCISGVSKQQVRQIAAEVRAFKKPEPYKGKGIILKGEIIIRKEGKKTKT